jgi:hypothetical protein
MWIPFDEMVTVSSAALRGTGSGEGIPVEAAIGAEVSARAAT